MYFYYMMPRRGKKGCGNFMKDVQSEKKSI